MTTYTGTIWKVNYGEIAELNQFRVGYVGMESYDAYFPVAHLSDLISVLGNAASLSPGASYRGAYMQVTKILSGLIEYIAVSPLAIGSVEIMRLPLTEVSDLQSTLSLFQADTGASTDDWDITRPNIVPEDQLPDRLSESQLLADFVATGQKGSANGVADLDGSAKLPESRVPDRLTDAQLSVDFVPSDQKGSVNGIAELDGTARLPESQVPERLTEVQLNSAFVRGSISPLNAKDFGAVGDGVTDDTAALEAFVAAMGSQQRDGVIPAGTYLTTRGIKHPQGCFISGAGSDLTIIRNIATANGMQNATTWHAGTYGANAFGAFNEPGYAVEPASIGSQTVTLSTPADAANFTIGDYVAIDGATASVSANIPNQVSRVVGISSAVITLSDALLDTFPSGSSLRVLNTGGVTSYFGDAAYMLAGGGLSGVTLYSQKSGYQGLHLACFGSTFRDVVVDADLATGGNPVVKNSFDNVTLLYGRWGYQPAYYSHGNRFSNLEARRSRTSTGDFSGVWIQAGEGARNDTFVDCVVEDYHPSASGTVQAVFLGPGCEWRGGRVGSVRPSSAAFYAQSGCIVEGVKINAKGGNGGIVAGGSGGVIRDIEVLNAESGQNAIVLGSSSSGWVVEGNSLGVPGSYTDADGIYDQGVGNVKRNNRGFRRRVRIMNSTPTNTTGTTSETAIATQTITAGVIQINDGWRITVIGNTIGAGSKTLRVKLNSTVVASVTLAAAGNFSVSGTLVASTGEAGFAYTFTVYDGTATAVLTGVSPVNRVSVTSLSVTAQLADAAGTFTTNSVDLDPIDGAGIYS